MDPFNFVEYIGMNISLYPFLSNSYNVEASFTAELFFILGPYFL